MENPIKIDDLGVPLFLETPSSEPNLHDFGFYVNFPGCIVSEEDGNHVANLHDFGFYVNFPGCIVSEEDGNHVANLHDFGFYVNFSVGGECSTGRCLNLLWQIIRWRVGRFQSFLKTFPRYPGAKNTQWNRSKRVWGMFSVYAGNNLDISNISWSTQILMPTCN